LDLGRGGIPGNYIVEEIWQELAKARYTEWEQGAAIRRRRQPALKEFCESLIKEKYENEVREVKDAGSSNADRVTIMSIGKPKDQPVVVDGCEQERMDEQ